MLTSPLDTPSETSPSRAASAAPRVSYIAVTVRCAPPP
jgi:hypothetical protein